MTSSHSRITLAYGLFFLSGMTALGYQVIWARMLLAGLGHEMPALLAVVSAFMAGLALGAFTLDRPIGQSRRPALWFAALQAVAALWGIIIIALIPGLNHAAPRLLGTEPTPLAHWTVAFGFPALAFFPATAALGASFAAMERVICGLSLQGRYVAPLYALNTLGAAMGVIVATGWLMPLMGLRASALLFASIPLACALLTLALLRQLTIAPSVWSKPTPVWSLHRLALTLFFTGLLGIGYEILVVHVLAQVLGDTIYTYATVLAVYLGGTALGAAAYRRWLPAPDFRAALIGMLSLLALSCLISIMVLGQSRRLMDDLGARLPGTWPGPALAEAAVIALVFLAPTLVMGAAWSHLVQAARRPNGGLGVAIAANALGAALAPFMFGILLLPVLGSKWALTATAMGYLALALLPRPAQWQWAWFATTLALLPLLPANLRILDLPVGAVVVAWREGPLGSLAVVREPDQHRTLRVDNRFQMGGTASAEMAARHAHLPLLLHPEPEHALILGVGTGLTLGAVTLHPNLRADGVELVPEMLGLMPWFEPENRQASHHPLLRMHVADARRFVLASPQHYDVIIADLFHPARDGAGLLYTREHFLAIRARLSNDGLFCQWLPLHQMSADLLRTVIRTFIEVFPDTHAWLLRFNVEVPVVGLVGYTAPPIFRPNWIEERAAHEPLGAELRAFALADSLRFLGHWLAGPDEIRAYAGRGPLNTDDHPRVLFNAPRQAKADAAEIHQRLQALLHIRQPNSTPLAGHPDEGTTSTSVPRWTAFVNARDVYLQGLIHDAEGRHALAIDAYVQSARLSIDFTSGYAQCLTIASLMAPAQSGAARALLQRLVEAQPGIPVARRMLDRLDRTQPRPINQNH